MAYEQKSLRRQKLRYDSDNEDNPVVFQLVVDGAKVTPASATIAITDPDGTAVLTASAMTASGTLLTYAVDTDDADDFPAATGYRADLAITVGTGDDAVVYTRHIVLDVVKYVLDLGIGRDQLLARDESILAAEHAGDEDLSPLIEACRDELQLKLEAKAFADERVIENMILDSSRVAVPARLYILWQFHLQRNAELAETYETQYRELWADFLAAIKYDKNLDGIEESSQVLVRQRLVT